MTVPDEDAARIKELEAQQRIMSLLIQISSALIAAHNETDIVHILKDATLRSPVGAVQFFYVDINDQHEPEWVTTVAVYDVRTPSPFPLNMRVHIPDFRASDLWLKSQGEAVIVGDLASDARIDEDTRSLYRSLQVGATVVIPVKKNHQWIGGVSLNWFEPQKFDDEDHALYGALMGMMVPVIESCWRLAEMEKIISDQFKVLVEQNERFRMVTDNISDLLALHDVTGKLLYLSPSYERMLGYQIEEFEKHPPSQVFHPDDTALFLKTLSEIQQLNGDPHRIEIRVRHRDGHYLWMETVVQHIHNQHGDHLGILAVSRDITQRKQFEMALRESEARFTTFMNNSPTFVFITDKDGILRYVNRAFHEIIFPHLRLSELIDHSIFDVFPQELAEQYHRTNLRVLQTRQTEEAFENFVQSDGSMGTAVTYKFPVSADAIGGIGLDVTERIKAEELRSEHHRLQLELESERELRQLKDRFMTMVSHEFRTPLAIINTSVEMFKRYFDQLTPEKRAQRLNTIQEQVLHLQTMMDEIQLLIHAQTEHLEFSPDVVDFGQFCTERVNHVRAGLGYNHQVTLSLEGDLRAVSVDIRLLRYILNNLLSNAIKYSPTGTEIQLAVTRHEQEIVLNIQDRGIGIKAVDLNQIWQPFFRGSNVGTVAGTGIGLKVVKDCVTAHHGTISVESAPGWGTRFTVRLPV